VLAPLVLWQLERRLAQWRFAARVADDAFGILRLIEPAVPHALGVEGDVRAGLALAEARVAQQVRLGIAFEQLDEATAQR
jgi:hypothetical protein